MTPDVLPCPFCGNTKIADVFIRDGRAMVCGDCSASVKRYQPDASAKAAAAWNTRLSAAHQPAWGDEVLTRAAASIAHMVDEWTQRGWNNEGREKFSRIVERRLKRFLPPPAPGLDVEAVARMIAGVLQGSGLLATDPEGMVPMGIVRNVILGALTDARTIIAMAPPADAGRVIKPEPPKATVCWRCGNVAHWDDDHQVFACVGFGCGIDIPPAAPPADASQSAEVERRLREALRQIKEQAEHRSFAAAAIEPNERAFVIMGKWFQEFEAIASLALNPTPPGEK